MKIVVTGASGYIGRHVVKILCDRFHDSEIICVSLNGDIADKGVKNIKMDILSAHQNQNFYELLGRPDVCIHLAWNDGFNHNSETHIANLPQHFFFLKNMIDGGCGNISVIGTMHEVGYFEGEINEETPCNPLSFYSIAKNALRQMLMSYSDGKSVSLKWLRAFYITGDDEYNKSIFTKIIQFEKEGKKTFPFTDGLNKYDFIDVKELADQIVAASLQNNIGGIINLCSGQPVALKDKVEKFLSENNFKIRPEYNAFPARKYDSPAIWGNRTKITKILNEL